MKRGSRVYLWTLIKQQPLDGSGVVLGHLRFSSTIMTVEKEVLYFVWDIATD